MESKDVGQLLQLLSEARNAGVLGDLLKSMEVQKGSGSSMNDSSKRRACQEQPVPESDSEDGNDWEEIPEVEVPKVITKEIWGKIYGKENMKIPLPEGLDVHKWGKTRIDMKKFAKLGASYEQAVALSYQGYEPMTTYLHWIMQTYGGKIGDTQAYDLGKYLLRIRFTSPTAKKSGFRRVFVD